MFAGRSRVTRDPEELEQIVAELDEIGGRAPDLAERIAGLKKVYGDEIAAITAARAQPGAVQSARLRMWADLSFSRYERGFAGKDRRTRDVALLEEIVADLEALRAPVAAMHEQAPTLQMDRVLGQIERGAAAYKREVVEIRASRRTGEPVDQGTRLAGLANRQFHVYTLCFARQSRISRHPAALERIVGALEEIRRAMLSLQAGGFANQSNDDNVRLVEDRIRAFRAELGEVRKAQGEADVPTRVSALASAANDIASAYRDAFAGKAREQTDPNRLDELFEQLWCVARQMDQLDRDHDDEINERNLRIVTDNLQLYAEEHRKIVAAQQTVAEAP
ncbi:MAG: hypothetical protein R3F59_32605 [Myxococcota bacterium]